MTVSISQQGQITLIGINRPESRNAVNRDTAEQLSQAFQAFEADPNSYVAILYGVGDHFCAGADLKAIARGAQPNRIRPDGDSPMGPARLQLSKPVIAALSGYAVAGGLELAIWADIRIADDTTKLGVFCRRFGVPLIDGGTVRLPRLIGTGRALDLIMTGREVDAAEALTMGLVNRVVAKGTALSSAIEMAEQIAQFPQECLRQDRMSVYEQEGMPIDGALLNEYEHGYLTISSGESVTGAQQFDTGAWKAKVMKNFN